MLFGGWPFSNCSAAFLCATNAGATFSTNAFRSAVLDRGQERLGHCVDHRPWIRDFCSRKRLSNAAPLKPFSFFIAASCATLSGKSAETAWGVTLSFVAWVAPLALNHLVIAREHRAEILHILPGGLRGRERTGSRCPRCSRCRRCQRWRHSFAGAAGFAWAKQRRRREGRRNAIVLNSVRM
jgi:hypothetical protein